METRTKCAYCRKEFEKKSKPFTPANCKESFHWKCYIRFVKERKKGADLFEDVHESVRVDAK